MDESKYIPEIKGNLKKTLVTIPEEINKASGIKINGRVLKSFIFTTDIAIIRNSNADAILAIYPFEPQPIITEVIMSAASGPVFCGVNIFGATSDARDITLAKHAEYQGASGVVVSEHTSSDTIREMAQNLGIPIILTVIDSIQDIKAQLEAGVSILNVSGAAKTAGIIGKIREDYPYVPIIATGGPSPETIEKTIRAGANAITYTPPSSGELFAAISLASRQRDNL